MHHPFPRALQDLRALQNACVCVDKIVTQNNICVICARLILLVTTSNLGLTICLFCCNTIAKADDLLVKIQALSRAVAHYSVEIADREDLQVLQLMLLQCLFFRTWRPRLGRSAAFGGRDWVILPHLYLMGEYDKKR